MKSNKGTLLFIGNFLPVPRFNKNVWHFLAEQLRDDGWTVITTSNQERQLPRLLDMLLTIWRERRSFQVAHIDVFSGRAFIFARLSSWLLRLIKKPIVLTLHGGGLPVYYEKHPRAVNNLLKAANIVVTPSAYLQKAFTGLRSDIRLIPNPIDLSEAIFRERFSVEPKLIWVRAFNSVYNPPMAIEALSLLCEKYPEAHLLMLGPDKGDGSLQRALSLAEELGVLACVQIVGHVDHTEIPQWLDQADIFINTSNYDTAPRSLLEAMANGLCVVSTNVGGIPLMATDGVEALLVDPDDAVAMSAAISRVLRDPDLARRLSRNARIRAEKADWGEILPQWDKLFLEVIKGEVS